MKLKCNHQRRVMVLPSGNTVHRSDGTNCRGTMTMGGKPVRKYRAVRNVGNVSEGDLVTLTIEARADYDSEYEKEEVNAG